MIDDENKDTEDLLKKKIPWKAIIKGIIAFLLLGTAYILMNLFSDFAFIGLVLICLSSTLMIPQLNEKQNNRHTISTLICENPECDIKKVQDYETGDYIFKISNSCPNCGSNLIIHEIYSVKIVEKTLKKKKDKSLKNS